MVDFLQRYMQQHNEVELSALGMGIVSYPPVDFIYLYIISLILMHFLPVEIIYLCCIPCQMLI